MTRSTAVSHTHTNVYSKTPVTAPGRDACFTPGYQAKRGKRPEKLSFHATTTLGHLKKNLPPNPATASCQKKAGYACPPPTSHWVPLGPPRGSVLGASILESCGARAQLPRTRARRVLLMMGLAERQICPLDVPRAAKTPLGQTDLISPSPGSLWGPCGLPCHHTASDRWGPGGGGGWW